MSQEDDVGGAGSTGQLGQKNLTTIHAVAQALAIGPMFSVALILGGVSRPDIGAGWNATLAVLDRRHRRARDRLHDLALRSQVRRRGGGVRVPHARSASVGRGPDGRLLLRGRAVPRRRGHLSRARDPHRRLLDDAHLRQRSRLVGVGDDRARGRPRPQLLRRAPRDPRDADVRRGLVRPDADPGRRDHRQGRREREHADDVQPERDVAVRDHRRRGARRDPARHPPLRRLRGSRLDRRGDGGSAQGDSPCADRHGRGRGQLLRGHGLCLLDRLRQGRGVGGRVGVLARPGQRDGDEIRRLVVRHDPRARRHPRCDGARARDLRPDRSRVLRARA